MKTAAQIGLVLAIVLMGLLPAQAAVAAPVDFSITDGHFFTQTGSEPDTGYSVTNEDSIPFWDAFQRLGGVSALGYPMSRRFVLDGLVSQATQRAILQWQPTTGRVALVNVLDQLHDVGADALLESCCSTPPPLDAASFDAGKSLDQVRRDRLALLDVDPAIRAAYFAVEDPIQRFGLPTSRVADEGNHLAIRLQRTVIQHWTQDVPWANAGEVTFANAGELAAYTGLIPLPALVAERVLEAPAAPAPAEASANLAAAAAAVQPATIQVLAPPTGQGTGFIIRGDGYALTANHVVAGAQALGVTLPDGRRLPAELVGRDPFMDVAVLKISDANLPVARIGDSETLAPGDPLVALGFGAPEADTLSVVTGQVLSLARRRAPDSSDATTAFVLSNLPLVPGYSGGPLVDAEGRVVGMNTAVITSSRSALRARQSVSLAIDAIMPIVQALIEFGSARRTSLGVTAADVTAQMAKDYALSTSRGALILQVEPGSPASRANVCPGDIIIEAGSILINDAGDLAKAIDGTEPGEVIPLEILAHDGKRHTAKVEVVKAGK